jgi:hypothetical protein
MYYLIKYIYIYSFIIIERKLFKAEQTVFAYVDKVKKVADKEILFAEKLVNKELRNKMIMAQWTNHFLANSDTLSLDPLSFAFCRYALNMCLCYAEVSTDYLVKSNVHKQLISLSSFENDLIVGPSLMALVHLSLHDNLKHEIVHAGVLPVLLKILHESNSKPILAQSLKLLGSCCLHFPNKVLVAQSGCMHAALDMIMHTSRDFFCKDIQYAACCVAANIVNGSDANRTFMVDLNGIKPILTALQTSDSNEIILEAVKALANTSYTSKYVAGCILNLGGDVVLVEVLRSSDILRQPLIAHAILTTLCNICNCEATQSHVASSPNCMESCIRLCDNARELFVVSKSADLLLAVMWNNFSNKSVVGGKNACQILVKRIIRHSSSDDEDSIYCVERLCAALSSLLLTSSNFELMKVIGGLDEMVRIVKRSSINRVMVAIAQVICMMVPSPNDLVRYHDEEFICDVERLGALPILKKARLKGLGHLAQVPSWIEKAILYLSLADEPLSRQPIWIKEEYEINMYFMEELFVEIVVDATVMANSSLKGLIYSLF